MSIQEESVRILTVYYTHQSGATRPLIRLQGKWLQELGFLPGAKIEVKKSNGGLLIRAVAAPELPEKDDGIWSGRR